MDRLDAPYAHEALSATILNSKTSHEAPATSSCWSSGSFFLSRKVSLLLLVLLTLCAHQVSSLPGASIESDRPDHNSPDTLSESDFEVSSVWKRDTMCQRGSPADDQKWDHCERCARTTRSRDTFKLCCSGAAYDYCTALLEYRPEEFNKRPRARRAPVNFNRLLRSVLSHNTRSRVW
jgi:hypothetical protein